MAQILIRQVDDEAMERLKARARARKTSVEAIARDAIHREAELTRGEKIALALASQEWSRRARIPGSSQSIGTELIREDRDNDR
jgi:plasmid stability protein